MADAADTTVKQNLDSVDHVAIPVSNIESTVTWYKERFSCTVEYQDDTWAFPGLQKCQSSPCCT